MNRNLPKKWVRWSRRVIISLTGDTSLPLLLGFLAGGWSAGDSAGARLRLRVAGRLVNS
jgi:hypothetical protein